MPSNYELIEQGYDPPETGRGLRFAQHQAPLLTTPTASLATAAEGFPAWDVLDAAHMLVASLIVDLVADGDRPGFLRKMDRVLRDRVKEIAARQKPGLVV